MPESNKRTFRVLVGYYVEAADEREARRLVAAKIDPDRDGTDDPDAWSAAEWDMEG